MKVRFVKSLEDWTIVDMTIGQVYEVESQDDDGVVIYDDLGQMNGLYTGEYEVVSE